MTERRNPQSTPALVIEAAIASTGVTLANIEEATGVPSSDLDAYLNGADISVASLVKVGGFLHLSPAAFMEAAA